MCKLCMDVMRVTQQTGIIVLPYAQLIAATCLRAPTKVASSRSEVGMDLSKLISKALMCRLRMDVMRVDTADGHHRFAMCTACYGYMGDLMATSERLRWLGPSRYNLAGVQCIKRHCCAPLLIACIRSALT